MKKLKKKSENLFHKKILLYKLISLENLLNVQYERHFSFELTKVANSFDEFMDNIENFNLGSYSRFFKK